MRITLATLPTATAQQVFDHVARHLITQGGPAVDDNGTCMYRDPDGLQCAAGCLIGDDEYDREDMEFKTWSQLVKLDQVPTTHFALITALQSAHDLAATSYRAWRDAIVTRLCDVAASHGLDPAVIDATMGGR